MRILAYINTYNRYDSTLTMCILSVINQTHKPDHFTIFDDNKEPRDLRQTEHFRYLFNLLDQKGITWNYVFAQKKGAHFSHEMANTAGFDLAWFLDDDQVAEPTCLENLLKEMTPEVGAVAGLILKPNAPQLPPTLKSNTIDEIQDNIQWYRWSGKPVECEHLYSSFLYRCDIVHHDLRLSKKVFRGETMFTHSLYLKGYKLLVTPDAITWHFEGAGGCRTPEEEKTNNEMYYHDEVLFRQWLSFKRTGHKIYVLNEGVGDNYMFRQVIKPEEDALIATCYPECWKDYKNIIGISEAEQLVDIKDFSVYQWCAKKNWQGHLIDAYKKMYEIINYKR